MKTIIIICLVLFSLHYFKEQAKRDELARQDADISAQQQYTLPAKAAELPQVTSTSAYVCDGRTHCSQMNSCEEAKYFINNCPGTEMDGDGDGIPCEKQFCNTF